MRKALQVTTTTIRQLIGMFGLARGVDPSGHLYSPPNEGDMAGWLTSAGYQPVFPAFRHGRQVFFDPFPSLIKRTCGRAADRALLSFCKIYP
jgi:hypothetical protein